MILPPSSYLPIQKLAACFNNTVATYKFYWLLAILDGVEKGETRMDKKHLFARMISNAWYTVNYFHLSFGKQDMLQRAIETLKGLEGIPIDEKRELIFKKLANTEHKLSMKELQYFDRQVPHWFLSPWFGKPDKKTIYDGSKAEGTKSLYELHDTHIVINPIWYSYLTDNISLLKAFCYWNLAVFLQAKNPNVPDIPNKLIRPAVRNSLNGQRKQYWDIVLSESVDLKCIYTNKQIEVGDYHVEHFVPYSFVSHDLIWNLIPADKSFNSRKSDRLPKLERYFDSFYHTQSLGIETVRRVSPGNKYLQDYLTIFPSLSETTDLSDNFTKIKFREVIQPLITIAANNGFEFMYEV